MLHYKQMIRKPLHVFLWKVVCKKKGSHCSYIFRHPWCSWWDRKREINSWAIMLKRFNLLKRVNDFQEVDRKFTPFRKRRFHNKRILCSKLSRPMHCNVHGLVCIFGPTKFTYSHCNPSNEPLLPDCLPHPTTYKM